MTPRARGKFPGPADSPEKPSHACIIQGVANQASVLRGLQFLFSVDIETDLAACEGNLFPDRPRARRTLGLTSQGRSNGRLPLVESAAVNSYPREDFYRLTGSQYQHSHTFRGTSDA